MNTILYDAVQDCHFVHSVRRKADGSVVVRTDKIRSDGSVFMMGITPCQNEKGANAVCKEKVKNKMRYGENTYWKVDPKDAPEHIKKHLSPEFKDQLTPTELLSLIASTTKERYVTLSSNGGLEDMFDVGIQYVGVDNGDADYMDVYDKLGNLTSVSKARIQSVEKTEDCIQAEKMSKIPLSS